MKYLLREEYLLIDIIIYIHALLRMYLNLDLIIASLEKCNIFNMIKIVDFHKVVLRDRMTAITFDQSIFLDLLKKLESSKQDYFSNY